MLFLPDKQEALNILSNKQLDIIKDCSSSFEVRFAILLHFLFPTCENSQVKMMLIHLRYDKVTISKVIKILHSYSTLQSMEISLYQTRKLLGMIGLNDIYPLLNCYHIASRILEDKNMEERYTTILSILKKILENKDPIYFHELAITGDDVLKLGIGNEDKKLVGDALNIAYEWVLHMPEMNNYHILISKLKKEYNRH